MIKNIYCICSICTTDLINKKYHIMALPMLGDIFYRVCPECLNKMHIKDREIWENVVYNTDPLFKKIDSMTDNGI